MSGLGVFAVLMLSALLVWLVTLCLLRANRLDRLHVRTDAARAALLAALERRAVVARAVAAYAGDTALRRAAAHAEHAPTSQREAAENHLGRLLGRLARNALPAALVAELTDAESRVALARRVHNDAVRDTLRLRGRRLVRWFRLAGPTPLPAYFEIADPVATDTSPTRLAARVVLLDPEQRVLLFESIDPDRPAEPFWVTPGGGIDAGEEPRAAATRELAEETGLKLEPDDLVGPVWHRVVVFRFAGRSQAADERFYLARTADTDVDTSGFSPMEAATVLRHRWWNAAELAGTTAVIYPAQLAELLPGLAGSGWDGRTREVR